MFTNDYIMRQIELLGAGAAKIFKKETKRDRDNMETRASEGGDSLREKLFDLIDEGKLCDAEDELFFYAKENPTSEVFGIAVEFYNALNDMSDEELTAGDFPRGDIAKGISAILNLIK